MAKGSVDPFGQNYQKTVNLSGPKSWYSKGVRHIMYHGLDLNSGSSTFELCDLKQVTQPFLQTSVSVSTR